MTGKIAAKTTKSGPALNREMSQGEVLLDVLAELRKLNFLMEQVSGVDVDVEAFNGRN